MKTFARKFSAASSVGLGLSGLVFFLEPSISAMSSVWMILTALLLFGFVLLTDPEVVS